MNNIALIPSYTNAQLGYGICVVLETSNRTARVFNSETDSVNNIIGVTTTKTDDDGNKSILGMVLLGGPGDPYARDEFLNIQVDEKQTFIDNPNYDPEYNTVTDDAVLGVLIRGYGAVVQGQFVPSSWTKLIDDYSENTDIYIINSLNSMPPS